MTRVPGARPGFEDDCRRLAETLEALRTAAAAHGWRLAPVAAAALATARAVADEPAILGRIDRRAAVEQFRRVAAMTVDELFVRAPVSARDDAGSS